MILSPLFAQLQNTQGTYGGECVSWIQKLLGFPEGFRGNADKIQPNSQTPEIGSVVLFPNHAALIVGRIADQLILAGSNNSRDGKIDFGYTVPVNDSRIRGFFVFKTEHMAGKSPLLAYGYE